MVVSNILEGKAHPFFNGFFDDKDPNSSSPKVHSRTRSKRFKFFGITTHELSKTTSITNQHNLQSLLLGRKITTYTTAQSAPAQTNTVNLQVAPVHALATLSGVSRLLFGGGFKFELWEPVVPFQDFFLFWGRRRKWKKAYSIWHNKSD